MYGLIEYERKRRNNVIQSKNKIRQNVHNSILSLKEPDDHKNEV